MTGTITETDFIITIDFGQTLEAMIAAGKYGWINPRIEPEIFPIEGTGIKKFRAKLFHFGDKISSEDGVTAIKKEGFEPATHVHGLAFGATFPGEQRKYPITCLGSAKKVRVDCYVVCLFRDGAGRLLGLCFWDGGWDDRWRFLGVQEV